MSDPACVQCAGTGFSPVGDRRGVYRVERCVVCRPRPVRLPDAPKVRKDGKTASVGER